MEPNGGADAHTHENMEQLFIVLKGALIMKSDQEEVRIEEGEAVLVYPGESHETLADNQETDYLVVTGFNYTWETKLNSSGQGDGMIRLKPFSYFEPNTLPEAVEILSEQGVEAYPLAGGTDILVRMKTGVITPSALIN